MHTERVERPVIAVSDPALMQQPAGRPPDVREAVPSHVRASSAPPTFLPFGPVAAPDISDRGAAQREPTSLLSRLAVTWCSRLARTGWFDPVLEGVRAGIGWETQKARSTAALNAWVGAPEVSAQEREERVQVAALIRWRASPYDDLHVRGELELSDFKLVTDLPPGLAVSGSVSLKNCHALARLPADLYIRDGLYVSHCNALIQLPERLHLSSLDLRECASLTHLARELRARWIDIESCHALTHLSEEFKHCDNIYIRDCPSLNRLPSGFACRTQLVIEGCHALKALPSDMGFAYINQLRNCASLKELPARPNIKNGGFELLNCDALARLPEDMTLFSLSVAGCASLTELPKGLKITRGSLRLTDSNVVALPADLEFGGDLELTNLPLLKEVPPALLERLATSRKRHVFKLENTGLDEQTLARLRGPTTRAGALANTTEDSTFTQASAQPSAQAKQSLLGQIREVGASSLAHLNRTGWFDPALEGIRAGLGWETQKLRSEEALNAWANAVDISPQEREERARVAALIRWRASPHDDLRVNGDLELADLAYVAELPRGLRVNGSVTLKKCDALKRLPEGFQVRGSLDVSLCKSLVCLSENLSLDELTLRDCASLTHVARGFRARYVTIERCESLTHLADDFKYCHNLYLRHCPSFSRLPQGFACGTQMVFEDCASLVTLPDDIGFAGISQFQNCPSLTHLPERPKIVRGGLGFSNCDALQRLPENMTLLSLDISRCRSLHELPRGLKITLHSLRVSDCNLTQLPEDLEPTSETKLSNLPLLKDIPLTLIERLEASGKTYLFRLEDTGIGAELQQRLCEPAPLRQPLPNVRFIFTQTKIPSAPDGNSRSPSARPQQSERQRSTAKVPVGTADPKEEHLRQAKRIQEWTAAMLQDHANDSRKPDYYIEDLGKEREMFRALCKK